MKIEELKEELLKKEKRLNKIIKYCAEKPTLEKEISELKVKLEQFEKERDSFFDKMNSAGISLVEAEEKLGL